MSVEILTEAKTIPTVEDICKIYSEIQASRNEPTKVFDLALERLVNIAKARTVEYYIETRHSFDYQQKWQKSNNEAERLRDEYDHLQNQFNKLVSKLQEAEEYNETLRIENQNLYKQIGKDDSIQGERY